jgi:aromatic ring-cleaving dioxygenase
MGEGASAIRGFHAHIYYDLSTRGVAARIREALASFNVTIGSWLDEPVGPHPKSMYQIAFSSDEFGKLVPWLMLYRQGLDVLVHPSTGDSLKDHLDHSAWLGTKLELNLQPLRR